MPSKLFPVSQDDESSNIHAYLKDLAERLAGGMGLKAAAEKKAASRRFVTDDRYILGADEERSASIGIGDLNGDGKNDLVVANGRHWHQQNYLFFNQGKKGTANFDDQRPLGSIESTSYAAKPVDLDGDGDLDIVVGNEYEPNRIFLNDGKGTFSENGSFGEVSASRDLTLADIDKDGDIDILIPCRGQPNQIALNDGSGAFPDDDIRRFGTGDDPTLGVAVVDWDGDQHLDLVLANRDTHPNVILLNDGKGDYSKSQQLEKSSEERDGKYQNSRAVAIADMNGDEHLDIIVGNIGLSNRIYFGDGKGGIIESQAFGPEDGKAYSLISGDIDNDGDVDLIVGNRATRRDEQRNAVYVNQGAGKEFDVEFDVIPFGDKKHRTYGVSAADFDQDGFLDIVVANSEASNQVFMNTPNQAVMNI